MMNTGLRGMDPLSWSSSRGVWEGLCVCHVILLKAFIFVVG